MLAQKGPVSGFDCLWWGVGWVFAVSPCQPAGERGEMVLVYFGLA